MGWSKRLERDRKREGRREHGRQRGSRAEWYRGRTLCEVFCKEEAMYAKGADLGEAFATRGSKAYWGTSFRGMTAPRYEAVRRGSGGPG